MSCQRELERSKETSRCAPGLVRSSCWKGWGSKGRGSWPSEQEAVLRSYLCSFGRLSPGFPPETTSYLPFYPVGVQW